MQFGNNPREYPDDWSTHLEGNPAAQPIFISKNIIRDPELAELQLKGIVAQRAKQTKAEFTTLSGVEEPLADGYAILVAQEDLNDDGRELLYLPCVETWSPPLVEDEDSIFVEIYG